MLSDLIKIHVTNKKRWFKMCYRGDIHWIKFESKEGSSVQGGGYRPAIILSNNMACKHSPVILISPITSKVKTQLPTHVKVGIESGLLKESIILLEQVQTIDKKDLGDYIGKVPRNKIYEIDRALIISGGIDIGQQQVTNVIDKEKINNLIDMINDTNEMLSMADNDYFKKVKYTLMTDLKTYCESCGANFELLVRNKIKEYTAFRVLGDVVSV
jgi:mRNA interferase MazF